MLFITTSAARIAKKFANWETEIMDTIMAEGFSHRPLYIHILCNPGCVALSRALRLAEKQPHRYGWLFSSLKGILMDSSPASVLTTMGSRYIHGSREFMVAIWRFRRFRKWIVIGAPIFFTGLALYTLWSSVSHRWSTDSYVRAPDDLVAFSARMPGTDWALVYDLGDRVCTGRGIAKFAKDIRAATDSRAPFELCLEDSEHLRHITLHKDAYIAFVHNSFPALCQPVKPAGLDG
jgi:hypothetical protein